MPDYIIDVANEQQEGGDSINREAKEFINGKQTTSKLQISDSFIHTMIFMMVISMMSVTMFNMVLPEISQEYDLSYKQVGWISTAYLLVYAIGSIFYGKLSDRFRLKSLLTIGLLLLSVGSMIGLTAHTYWMILFSRIIQAMGASVIPALAMIIPARYISTERRGKVLGMMGSGLALGGVLGLIASAFVADFAHWRWLFVIPLMTLLTLPQFHRYLASERVHSSSGIDWFGGFLLGGSVTTLLLTITGGRWWLASIAIVLLLLFVVRIRLAEQPFIEASLFHNNRYSFGIVLAFLVSAVGFSIPFLTPIMLVDIYNLTPGTIGLVMIPASLASVFFGKQGGKIADRKGNAPLFILASLFLLVAFLLLAILTGESLIFIAIALIIGQVGQTFIVVAVSGTVASTLSKKQAGVGMGLMSMLNFIASSVSGALISRVVDQSRAPSTWSPFNWFGEANIYNNLYLILALSYVVLLFFYNIKFGSGSIFNYHKNKEMTK